MISMFDGAKTIRASDRVATLIDTWYINLHIFFTNRLFVKFYVQDSKLKNSLALVR
jgi:hypothetical protein